MAAVDKFFKPVPIKLYFFRIWIHDSISRRHSILNIQKLQQMLLKITSKKKKKIYRDQLKCAGQTTFNILYYSTNHPTRWHFAIEISLFTSQISLDCDYAASRMRNYPHRMNQTRGGPVMSVLRYLVPRDQMILPTLRDYLEAHDRKTPQIPGRKVRAQYTALCIAYCCSAAGGTTRVFTDTCFTGIDIPAMTSRYSCYRCSPPPYTDAFRHTTD